MRQANLFDPPAQPPIIQKVKETVGASRVSFDGETYEPKHDQIRLAGQMLRVWRVMRDQQWRTLEEIEIATGDPQASISARLRDFRKKKFGEHGLNKRPRGDREHGLFEYQLAVNGEVEQTKRREDGPKKGSKEAAQQYPD